MRKNNWNTWNQFKRDMNNVFKSDVPIEYGSEKEDNLHADTYPFINIEETEDNLIINADVPGFDKDEIKVNLTEDELEINAEKEDYEEEETKYIISRERDEERMYRKITLPEKVSPQEAIAKLDKGVLTITAPKSMDDSGKDYLDIE